MSADHKRPLYAFVIVAVLCALIIGNELRSQAATIGHVLSAGAAHVIPGMTIEHEPGEAPVLHRPQPLVRAATPAPVSATPTTGATSPSVVRVPPATAPAHALPQTHAASHAAHAAHAAGHAAHAATHEGHPTGRSAGHVFGQRPPADVRHVVHAVVGAVGLSASRHPEHRLVGSRPGRGHGLALGLVHHGRSHGWVHSHHGPSHARTHTPGPSHGHGRGHARGHGHGHR